MLAKEFYEKHMDDRSSYEERAKLFSYLTIPYVFPEDMSNSTSSFTDVRGQSFGARLVRNLMGKMGMAMFPADSYSFDLRPNSKKIKELALQAHDTAGEEVKGEYTPDDFMMALYSEKADAMELIQSDMENIGTRGAIFDILLQLILVGSCIIENEEDGIAVHTLRNISADLDKKGEVRGYAFVEEIFDLPEGIDETDPRLEQVDGGAYMLYTMVEKVKSKKDKWEVSQSIGSMEVIETKTYSTEKLPYEYLGWNFVMGNDYHRPYIEDFAEDLIEYNKLTNLLVEGSIGASRTLIMVDERGGRTSKRTIENAKNMDVVRGKEDDISVMQFGKNYDFQIPFETRADIKKDLNKAFMSVEGAQRDAERVTAQEFMTVARELESSNLAEVYSKLNKKVLKKMVQWSIHRVGIKFEGAFEGTEIKIVTGVDALGRTNKARNLDMYMERADAMGYKQEIKSEELGRRYAQAFNINTNGLVKTPHEKKAEAQQQAQQQQAMIAQQNMAQSAGQEAGKQQVQQQGQ